MEDEAELWIKGKPDEIKRIIERLKVRGYGSIQDICKDFKKKIVVLC